jgi:hypothetical protein
MKKIIFIFIFVLYFVNISALEYHYEINLLNNQSGIYLDNINLKLDKSKLDIYSSGELNLKVLSYDYEILYESYFTKIGSAIIEGDLGEGYFDSELIYYNLTKINLFVPYYPNAKEIIIYDENLNKLNRIDVSMYSKEYQKISNQIIEEENISREEVGITGEKIQSEKIDYIETAKNYWWILIIIFVVLFLKLIWNLISKKK